jgi:hypothetical protein
MSATGSPVLHVVMKWTATDSRDLRVSMAPIEIASPVRPNVVASMVLVLPVGLDHHSMHV